MSTNTTTNPVPVCVRDEYGCPLFLACGHYWKRCGGGCPGWGGIEPNLPWWLVLEEELINRGLIARGLMTTATSRTAARAGNSLGGAA